LDADLLLDFFEPEGAGFEEGQEALEKDEPEEDELEFVDEPLESERFRASLEVAGMEPKLKSKKGWEPGSTTDGDSKREYRMSDSSGSAIRESMSGDEGKGEEHADDVKLMEG
jgi:hypothetical protein